MARMLLPRKVKPKIHEYSYLYKSYLRFNIKKYYRAIWSLYHHVVCNVSVLCNANGDR